MSSTSTVKHRYHIPRVIPFFKIFSSNSGLPKLPWWVGLIALSIPQCERRSTNAGAWAAGAAGGGRRREWERRVAGESEADEAANNVLPTWV